MIKKKLYPHTERIKENNTVQITEKMDGSNIGFFNKDGELLVCTRNYIISLDEIEKQKNILQGYKGLYEWLQEYGEVLKKEIYVGSGIFCEWMGTNGHVKYPQEVRYNKVYIFAKARITDNYEGEKIIYDINLFKYAFNSKTIPAYMDIVPVVWEAEQYPTVSNLDELYQSYSKDVSRNVEGFVVSFNDRIEKYVRMKNGKLEKHHQ